MPLPQILPQGNPALEGPNFAKDWYRFLRDLWQHTGAGGRNHPLYAITQFNIAEVLDGPSADLETLPLFNFSPHFSREVAVSCYLPLSYSPDTAIVPFFDFWCIDADAADVIWDLEYLWMNYDDGVQLTTSTITSTTASAGAAHKPVRAEFAEITGTGKRPGSIFVASLRHRGDLDFPGISHDLQLLGAGFFYQTNGVGNVLRSP